MKQTPIETTLYSLSDLPPAPDLRSEDGERQDRGKRRGGRQRRGVGERGQGGERGPDSERGQDSERRGGGERQLTLFRVGALTVRGGRELCLIKNVSAGGMLIRAYCAIDPGERLSVELKCGEQVSGTGCWVDGNLIGITFDQPVDVVELLATSMGGPRPRMPRVEVDCGVFVREGAATRRATARDISQGGVKLATARPLTFGGEVVVMLPGLGPRPGLVCWEEAGQYGIAFNRVLPLGELVAWLHSQRDRMRAGSLGEAGAEAES